MKRYLNLYSAILILTLFFYGSPAPGEEEAGDKVFVETPSGTPILTLGLDQATEIALKNSHNFAAQRETASAAHETAISAKTQLYPQISAEASSNFISKIGKVNLPPGSETQIGDHYSWAVGPVLNWVAWDFGSIYYNAKSLKRAAEAEDLSTEALRRNVLYNARMAYFSVQLASEQLRLVADAIYVARSQYSDIGTRYNAGSASRLDLVNAHQEVLEREKDYENAARELAIDVRNLVAILGIPQLAYVSFPADSKMVSRYKGLPVKPDLLLNLDPINASLKLMEPRAVGDTDIYKHPAYKSAKEQSVSSMLAYKSTRASYWPEITVEGKSSYQYPNFAELENVQQNSLLLNLNFPFLDWGHIIRQARSARHKANAATEQMKETGINLERDLGQTIDSIAVIQKGRKTYAASARDAAEIARLTYEEYLAGHLIFTEVKRANLEALQAKVDEARNTSMLLGQLARMESLINSGD